MANSDPPAPGYLDARGVARMIHKSRATVETWGRYHLHFFPSPIKRGRRNWYSKRKILHWLGHIYEIRRRDRPRTWGIP